MSSNGLNLRSPDLIQRPIRRLQTADPDISIHHPIRRITLGYNVADENDHLISWTGNNVADEIVLLWDPAVIVREDGAGGWSTWWWRKWYILEWQVRSEMVEGMFLVCLVVVRVPASAGGYHQCSQAEAGNRKS